jgi:uncharacterized protein (DUF1778 family)
MARADEPRITFRCSVGEREAIDRAARVAGVATGALARECALRWGAVLAAEIVSKREIRLRRRSGVRAVTRLGPRP